MALSPLLLAGALASALACGGGETSDNRRSISVDHGSTAPLDAVEVLATRSAGCAGGDPPFSANDGFVFDVHGPRQSDRSYAAITVKLTGKHTAGETVQLAPEPRVRSSSYESASAADTQTSVSLFRGNDGKGIDPSALKTASLGIVESPTMSGETMSLRITLSFEDGKVLDQTFSSTVPALTGGPCADAGAPR